MEVTRPATRSAEDRGDEREVDVRIDHVTKVYAETVAVDDLVLEIATGEFFSLLGPSGCGKTTTLRVVGGFEDPTSGLVYLGGQNVTTLPPYRRNVNTVFQSYALFGHLDVFENVAFGLRRRKVPAELIEQRVRETLTLVDLVGLEKRRPRQLSGGQQQRVALARALANRPKVLLLDEPMGALDAKLRKQMQLELKRIQQEVGITFLYVTHDQEEAMSMSERLAVMRHGRIEDMGPPAEVYDNPATEFVAGFLGASNLIDGAVEGSGVGEYARVVDARGDVFRVLRSRAAHVGTRSKVRIGVRPEKIHVELGNSEPTPGMNHIMGTVASSIYLGVSNQYTVESADGRTLTVYSQNLGSDVVARPGDQVRLAWLPEHTFVVRPSESAT